MSPPEAALEEMARWSSEPLTDLRLWESLGLLPDDSGTPLANRLERVRLIRFAIGRGYAPDRLAEIAAAHGDMIGRFAEQIGAMVGEPVCTVDEAARQAGLDPQVFERVLAASGLGDEPFATEVDLGAARLIKTALDFALPPEVLSQMLRVFSDSMAKIADAGSRLFHLYVHEQMRAGGAGGEQLLATTNTISEPLLALVEPAVIYYHQKAWQQALREDMMLHLAEEATAPSSVPGEFTRAILFADLSSFTPLTEVMGDAAAAEVVARFSDIVRASAALCSGQVVKQIGDEFMLVFPDGQGAVACGLEIAERAASESRFPALTIGAHVGSVLYREGDYVGTSVNLAARVTSAAQRNQFLVTEAVRRQLGELEIDVVPLGARSLKGLGEDVELFELRRPGARAIKVVDPVCGMELDSDSIEATLAWHGEELSFCAAACLERFVGDPARYRSREQR
ncbi:MAG: YHS domain-containing protein [Actinobacteria bacterium]|nr:MAG: YHS domain-containing protein [Actinomycetota bacterium]